MSTITNRLEDLPPWFKLHPTEICDSFVYKLREKVERGDYPDEPLDGPTVKAVKGLACPVRGGQTGCWANRRAGSDAGRQRASNISVRADFDIVPDATESTRSTNSSSLKSGSQSLIRGT